MAVTVTGSPEAGGMSARVALTASAGDAQAVTLPEWVRKCTLQFVDSGDNAAAGRFLRGVSQVDGAAISSAAFPVSAGAAYELTTAPFRARVTGGATIYLSGSAGGYCYLDLEL